MITVIGRVGCKSCEEIKDKLTKEGKEFRYFDFDKLPRTAKQLYAAIIRNENKGHFPLVLDNNGVMMKEGAI